MKFLSISLVNFSYQLSKNQIKITNILTNSYFKMYQNVAFNQGINGKKIFGFWKNLMKIKFWKSNYCL
jgi:hypothetical protein